jgi:molybdopterin-dependent oxidoreductase alpha subunit
MAVLYGVSKYLFEKGLENTEFIENYTDHSDEYISKVKELSWDEIASISGLNKTEIEEIAEIYGKAKNVIFSWAMGITHHRHGVENVEAIVNLAMTRGMLGRKNAGLLPLRGHSNVQGVGSVGVAPVLKEKIFQNIEEKLNIRLPKTPGWDTMECMNQAYQGNVNLAFILGGNLYASNPNLNFAEKALNQIPFKVFLNTTLNEGHLRGIEQDVLILPVKARDEEEQKTTQESMFNYVRLSDGGLIRHSGTRSEYDIILRLAKAIISKETFDFTAFEEHRDIRKVISKVIPGFEQLEHIDETLEEFQIKGRSFYQPVFGTANGKAQFRFTPLLDIKSEGGSFKLMSVRSEGQFNSIIYEEKDAWRGVDDRNTILMNQNDMKESGLIDGDQIYIKSKAGSLRMKVQAYDIKKGCVLGYYPETNILVTSDLDPQSKTPAFKNTEVWIEKV